MNGTTVEKMFYKNKVRHRSEEAPSSCRTCRRLEQERELERFDVNARKRRRITQYMRKIVKNTKAKERRNKVVPLHDVPLLPPLNQDNDIQEFCRNCPSTSMSRPLERDILRRVSVRGLRHQVVAYMAETKAEFLKITHQAGTDMKLKCDKKRHVLLPYKYRGRTENYAGFLARRVELETKFLLHYPLIKRILYVCVSDLPYELFDLNRCLRTPLDFAEFQHEFIDFANDASQYLQEFYMKIVGIVERDDHATRYIAASNMLVSINISRTIAHSLLHVVDFSGSTDHKPYLKLTVTFDGQLILRPTIDDVVTTYEKFLDRLITTAQNFHIFRSNKRMQLCLTDEFINTCLMKIRKNITEKYDPIFYYVTELERDFLQLYDDINSKRIASDLIFDEGCQKITDYRDYSKKVAFIPDIAFFLIGPVILTVYRETLKAELETIINNIFSKLSAQQEYETSNICETFQIIHLKATQEPITTEEVIEVSKYMTWIKEEYLDELKERLFVLLEYLTKLIQLGPLTDEHMKANAKAIKWIDRIQPVLDENTITFEQLKFEAEEKLQKIIEDVTVDIKNVYPLLDILDSMDDIARAKSYLNSIILQMGKILEIDAKIKWINQEEVSLSFPKSTYAEFEDLKNYVYPFYHLIKLCLNVKRNLSVWLDGQFDRIHYGTTKSAVKKYKDELLNTQKLYRSKLRQAQDENLALRFKGTVDDPDMLNWPAPLKLCSKAIKLIQDFEPALTVIKIMCNEALMERHWVEMSKIAQQNLSPNAGTTLRKMIEIDLTPNLTQYESISLAATKEKQLLEHLNAMKQELNDTRLTIENRVIIQIDDIEATLDDQLTQVVCMRSSVSVKPYATDVKLHYNALIAIKNALQMCKTIQNDVVCLHSIFDGIIQQNELSSLYKQIVVVHKNYTDIITSNSNNLKCVIELVSEFHRCLQLLENLNSMIDAYFERTRLCYPRLYFLARDEMFNVIAGAKDPIEFQKSLTTIFPAVKSFNSSPVIAEVVSWNDETIRLNEPVDVGNFDVEVYLPRLESQIHSAVHCLVGESLDSYYETELLIEWIKNWPLQILIVVLQITFTTAISQSDTSHEIELSEIIAAIKDARLKNAEVNKLSAAYLVMRAYKNISDNLKSLDDFLWWAQAKFILHNEKIQVAVMDVTVEYGNELVKTDNLLVVTPQTDRYLMAAYNLNLHAVCYGVPGSGKKETVKNLSSAFAIFCYYFTCSQSSSLESILNFIEGVSKYQCWLCLSNFDKICASSVSVIAQRISEISKRDDLKRNSNSSIFLTIRDSTYELPHNIRTLFRSVTFTTPDLRVMAETGLSSLGFTLAKSLANRIVISLELFQDAFQYDIGIRTLMEILKACKLSRDENEENTVLGSIKSTIVPVLSVENIKICHGILLDLFASTLSKDSSGDDFIVQELKALHLQPKREYVIKIREVYEMYRNNKSGVIITGKALTGKSTMINVLAKAMKLDYVIIKHNAMSLDELYGKMEDLYRWGDGFVTKLFRSRAKKWITFDGSIDSTWVEHLNPVLDHQKMFCLSSGEVLPLADGVFIIFETDGLVGASPAVTSRCGIVHLDEKILDWQPMVKTWMSNPKHEWCAGFESSIYDLFEWSIAPSLEYIKANCCQLYDICDVSLVKTVMLLIEMFMCDAWVNKKDDDTKNVFCWIQASFVQAGVWGLAATLDSKSRSKFDEFYKQLWRGQITDLPKSVEKVEVSIVQDGMISDYHYIYKGKGNWKFWPDVLKLEKIAECNFSSELFIPTVETVKYSSIVRMHVHHKHQILLVGPQGTGKSCLFQDILWNKLEKNKFEPSMVTLARKINSGQLQKQLISKLSRNRSGKYGSSDVSQTAILFIDDLHIPDSSSSFELLRQIFDNHNFFDTTKMEVANIENTTIIAALDLHDNSQLSQRFLRHFNVFSINEIHDDSIVRIYTTVLLNKWKKMGFPSDIANVVHQIINATLNFYKSTLKELTPNFNRNIYRFNLINFGKVIQGCSMVRKESADSNRKLFCKLWTHEVSRVFGDRMENQQWVCGKMRDCVQNDFGEDFEGIFENLRQDDGSFAFNKLMFGSYSEPGRFDEIDVEQLRELFTNCMNTYNDDALNKIDVVLFDFALEHLSKICRILSMSSSNMLQIGHTGSGRETLVKLACHCFHQTFFAFEVTCSWQGTLKKVLKEAGGYNKPCVFFVREELIDNFDDVDWLLKTGEIPCLYQLEETEEIFDLVRSELEDVLNLSPKDVMLYYKKHCRENLHIILNFSPASVNLGKYVNLYPSIIKHCDVSYINSWPSSALESIALAWIESLEIAQDIKERTISVFSYIHISLANNSFYTLTSGPYIEFIKLYVHLIKSKQTKITEVEQRYLSALEKLSFAAFQISEMQKSLAEYQPQLEEMTTKATEMTLQIEKETIEVEKASNLVKQDEKIANEQAAAAQILKLDCEADLAQAIPILEDAISALNTLKPTDITLVKSMKNPPDAIKLVMAAVCVIKDVKPDRVPDPSTGRKILDYWGPSKRILGDMNFLQTLKDFDKDHIKPEIMVKIRKDYLPHKDFKPHIVAKASSAAEGLCKWIIAMDMYDKVAKEVAPKKEKLEKAEREYGHTIMILNEKKEQVARIEQKLADLKTLLDEATRKQQKLQRNVDLCKQKLKRAQRLIGGLSEEKTRWINAVERLKSQFDCLPGDMLMSSAIVSYLGSVSSLFRSEMIDKWFGMIQSQQIPCNSTYNFIQILGNDFDIENWHVQQLPVDTFLIENAVISKFTLRWPLFIDPHNQARNWIKNTEAQNSLQTATISDPSYLTTIKNCVTQGKPLLFELPECANASLTPLFIKSIHIQNDATFITLGTEIVEYHTNFNLYLITNNKYPTYGLELYDKVNLIDFKLNPNALQEQLVTILVEIEKPILKKVKRTYDGEVALNKTALEKIEEKILKTLSESETDILEDENALAVLDDAKVLSRNICKKQEGLKDLKNMLDGFRADYESVAIRGTTLYYCLCDLAKINRMYRFSVEWFRNLYFNSIRNAPNFRDSKRRLISFMETITRELYKSVSNSIYENDKVLFSFLIASSILLEEKKVTQEELMIFASKTSDIPCPNPASVWLADASWSKICRYENFKEYFINHLNEFKEIHENPDTCLPEPWNSGAFSRLLIFSLLRPNKTYMYVTRFVNEVLGDGMATTTPLDITRAFNESYILSPLIYVLTSHSNPKTTIQKFAEKRNFANRLRFVTVDFRNETETFRLIETGQNQGLWICVQNCHLNINWLLELQYKLEQMDYCNTHENFRLWLTTNQCAEFPISLLERSVKMIETSPRGHKQKLLDLYQQDPINNANFYASCLGNHQDIFAHCLYIITFYHCAIQELRNLAPYCWNIPYKFSKNDLTNSLQQLQLTLRKAFANPFDELHYLIGECIYGNRVFDSFSKRRLNTILSEYLNADLLKGTFGLPLKRDHQDYISHITKLPDIDNIEIFGVHKNYEVVKDSKDSRSFLEAVFITSAQGAVTDGHYHRNLEENIDEILLKLPQPIDIVPSYENYLFGLIIQREISQLNGLLAVIKRHLNDLLAVLSGISIISSSLENVSESILLRRIPTAWMIDCANCSLSSYIRQLIAKFRSFQQFSEHEICLGDFFKPKALLAATKFYVAKHSFNEFVFSLEAQGDDGLLVNGLSLIGATWNSRENSFSELPPKVLQVALPTVSLVVIRNNSEFLECPLYKTICDKQDEIGQESGVLSSVICGSKKSHRHWIKRSVSFFCQNHNF